MDLALNSKDDRPVLLREIAGRQQISLPYLEHLIAPLVASGIVRSIRGPKGGILLQRAPQEVKMSEVIRLLEGSIAPVECIHNPESCTRADYCVTRDVWGELEQAMMEVLEATTLQDLMERQRRKGQPKTAMYYI